MMTDVQYMCAVFGVPARVHTMLADRSASPLNHSTDSPSKVDQQLQYHGEHRFYGGIPPLKDKCTLSCTFVHTLPDGAITQSRGESPVEVNKSVCAASEF